MIKPAIKKVVLAYSGGLDTSIIVPWLRENYGCEVVCYCSDVGQGAELDGLEARARKIGADQEAGRRVAAMPQEPVLDPKKPRR